MRKFVAVAAIAALAFAAPAGAQEAKFKAVSFLPLSQSFGVHFKRWVDAVNSRGKGVLQIEAVGPEAIPVLEQPNAVKNGVVQMHFGPPTFYTGVFWEGEALSLSEISVKEMRANGGWAYLDKLHREKLNAVLLGGGIGDGIRFFVYTTTPAKSDDKDKPMQGLTLRSVPLYKAFFDSLGARTVRCRRARCSQRSSARWCRAMAGRPGASRTWAGCRSRNTATARASSTSTRISS